MKPIAIFYHCLFQIGDQPLPAAQRIIYDQMTALKKSGLYDAASEIHIGLNGGDESKMYVEALLPQKAKVTYHGLDSRAENLTIVMVENWVKEHDDWNVLYFHAKGATHPIGSPYGEGTSKPWRQRMMRDLIDNWRQCVLALDSGHDIACSTWMWGAADGTQHIPAGNFLWVKSSFVRKLPSIFHRDRIKMSGIASLESRYEAEVYWGNGPRPNVKQFSQFSQ